MNSARTSLQTSGTSTFSIVFYPLLIRSRWCILLFLLQGSLSPREEAMIRKSARSPLPSEKDDFTDSLEKWGWTGTSKAKAFPSGFFRPNVFKNDKDDDDQDYEYHHLPDGVL